MHRCSDRKSKHFIFREILQSSCPELSFTQGKPSAVWSTHKTSQWSKAAIVVDGFELVSIGFSEIMSIFSECFIMAEETSQQR